MPDPVEIQGHIEEAPDVEWVSIPAAEHAALVAELAQLRGVLGIPTRLDWGVRLDHPSAHVALAGSEAEARTYAAANPRVLVMCRTRGRLIQPGPWRLADDA